MGFSTVATQVMFVFIFILVFASYIYITTQYNSEIHDAAKARNAIDLAKANTRLHITQVTTDGAFIYATVQNDGTTILDPEKLVAYVDNNYKGFPNNVNELTSFSNPGLLDPLEQATLRFDLPSPQPGTHRIVITTPAGTSVTSLVTVA